MSKIKFGTDGWRAIIADDFTFDNIKKVAQGIANYMKNRNLAKKGIVIAYDNRFLSKEFARECARVLLGNGIKVNLFRRVAPTPVAAYAVRMLETGGALMITASHNPPEYNGIKFIPEYAGPALPDVTDVIEDEIQKVLEGNKIYELDLAEAEALELLKEIDIEREYTNHLLKIINQDCFKKEHKLKVVVDPMFGAGVGYLDKILTDLGCEVRTMNNYRDPLFGGLLPEPTEHILSDLKRAVLTYNADIGLALDGDADRFGIIDREGNFISANHFAYILFEHLISTRTFKGPVCRSVATTHMLDKVARNNGLSVIETPVGFKYIGEALREKGCIMGVEESGGLSIFGHIPEKDGILSCLLAVEMLVYTGKSIKEISEEHAQKYGHVVSERLDIKVSTHAKPEVEQRIDTYQPRSVAGIKVDRIDEIDGKKILMENGSWVLIRASGTEPVFRIYLEAGSKEDLEDMKEEVLEIIALKS